MFAIEANKMNGNKNKIMRSRIFLFLFVLLELENGFSLDGWAGALSVPVVYDVGCHFFLSSIRVGLGRFPFCFFLVLI